MEEGGGGGGGSPSRHRSAGARAEGHAQARATRRTLADGKAAEARVRDADALEGGDGEADHGAHAADLAVAPLVQNEAQEAVLEPVHFRRRSHARRQGFLRGGVQDLRERFEGRARLPSLVLRRVASF